ncbi:FG-GAP repeat protein [Streptomyces sp. YIM 130001]|uniref:FG-GAP repeat protein n=1 Tax=Streptomyces sp. YIM 130001 TaxID=2259644 RepID=UPI000E651119|nr:FG-GAP repeat protein [Streptomyces sp. YIM 130001]RII06870.1 FG-GAP repeat protein [Streptomyces sp. YIM 130001]
MNDRSIRGIAGRDRAGRRLRGGAALTAALVCLLAGCGSEQAGGDGGKDGKGDERPHAASDEGGFTSPSARPGEPPSGKGSKDPDDLNGDGHRDFLTVATPAKAGARGVPTVVWGSAKGLDKDHYSTYAWDELGLSKVRLPTPAGNVGGSGMLTADLDSDGFPELIDHGKVVWGGPQGPRKDGAATPLRTPDGKEASDLDFTRGDFDADGHHDLAAVRSPDVGGEDAELMLMYGPFTREGKPARTDSRSTDQDGMPVAAPIDPTGKRPGTDLLTCYMTEGEQAAPTRYGAAKGGLARNGEKLREGNGTAFGDFDGDGKQDLIVGDTGTSNDELSESENHGKDAGTATLYPGNGGKSRTFRLPKADLGEEYNIGFSTLHRGEGKRDGLLVPAKSGGFALEVPSGERVRLHRTMAGTVDGKKLWKYDHDSGLAGAVDVDGDGRDEALLEWTNRRVHETGDVVPSHWWFADPWKDKDKLKLSTVPYASH